MDGCLLISRQSLEEALKHTQEISAKVVANKAVMKNCIGGFAGSLKDLYFLVVLARKVQVMYGWKELWAISANGLQSVELISD